jgi:hypothetical protein
MKRELFIAANGLLFVAAAAVFIGCSSSTAPAPVAAAPAQPAVVYLAAPAQPSSEGPAGPTGAAGPTGSQGPTGATGSPGR